MWMAAAGVEGLDAGRCIAFTDSSHVVQAVLDGGAVGLVEQDLVAEDLARGRLVRLFDIAVGLGPAYAYHLLYPQRSQGQPAIEALRAWVLREDRKSTRLNSSHLVISYAVFCLKKKNT